MSLIQDFKNATLIINRSATGSYVDGRFVPGPITQLSVDAVVQQATPDEIRLLPEGRRGGEIISVFTEIELKTTDESSKQTKGDSFVYLGKTFEVHKIGNWNTHFGLNHFKSVAVKQDDQTGADRGP